MRLELDALVFRTCSDEYTTLELSPITACSCILIQLHFDIIHYQFLNPPQRSPPRDIHEKQTRIM